VHGHRDVAFGGKREIFASFFSGAVSRCGPRKDRRVVKRDGGVAGVRKGK